MKKKVNSIITRDFSELTAQTNNIYESVVIIARRARQVALDLKKDLDNKLVDFRHEDPNMGEKKLEDIEKTTEDEQAAITRMYEQLPKPVTIAIEEFLEKKLTYGQPQNPQ